MIRRTVPWLFLGLLFPPSLGACFVTGTNVTTARTLEPGTTSHTLVGTMLGSRTSDCPEDARTSECVGSERDSTDARLPSPGYALRTGVGEGWELGVDSQFPGTLGADLKRELARTRYFDLAVRPTLHTNVAVLEPISIDSSLSNDLDVEPGFGFALPVLADVNLSRSVSFVPHGRAGGMVGTWLNTSSNDVRLLYGGGLGVDWRVTPSTAIHPDVSVLYITRTEGAGADAFPSWWLSAAVGLVLGAQPRF